MVSRCAEHCHRSDLAYSRLLPTNRCSIGSLRRSRFVALVRRSGPFRQQRGKHHRGKGNHADGYGCRVSFPCGLSLLDLGVGTCSKRVCAGICRVKLDGFIDQCGVEETVISELLSLEHCQIGSDLIRVFSRWVYSNGSSEQAERC